MVLTDDQWTLLIYRTAVAELKAEYLLGWISTNSSEHIEQVRAEAEKIGKDTTLALQKRVGTISREPGLDLPL